MRGRPALSKQPSIWIDQDTKRAWMNPLDPEVVMRVLKKTEYKNGLYNGYVGAMRLALQLMVHMMADPDPVIASMAALNLMRSDGYSGLVGLPAIKTALRRVQQTVMRLQAEQEELASKAAEGTEDKPAEQEELDPLTQALLAQINEREETDDGTGSTET